VIVVWVWFALVANALVVVTTMSAFMIYKQWQYYSVSGLFNYALAIGAAVINSYVIIRALNLRIESKKTPAA
jgi:hypothetical protein